jgi:hypothetical protein
MSDLTPEKISEADRDAVDVYYNYNGRGPLGWGPKNDQDRIEWMDYKDSLKKKSHEEFFPIQMALLGFGAAAVLLTPAGWVLALGVGAAWGGKKFYRKWHKTRALNAYARTFIFNGKGVVVEVREYDADLRLTSAAVEDR